MTDFLDCMRPPEPKTEPHTAHENHVSSACQTCPGVPPVTRILPCPRTTWCTLDDGHTGDCHEVPRRELPPSDFGPEQAKRRRY